MKKALSRDEQLKRLRIQAEKKYAQIRLVFCLLKALRPMMSYEQMCRDMPCISGGAFVLPTHHASDNSGWELADAVDDALIDELRAALRAGRLFGLAADTSVLIGNKDYMTIELYTVVGGRRAVFFCCLSEVGTRTNAVGYTDIILEALSAVAGASHGRKGGRLLQLLLQLRLQLQLRLPGHWPG